MFVVTGAIRNFMDPNSSLFVNYVITSLVCICLWVSVMIIKHVFHSILDDIRWLSLIIFGISLGVSIPILIRDPGIARYTMGNENESMFISMYFPKGIANYTWYTSVAFAWPVVANWLYKCKQSSFRKVTGWGALFLLSISVILSTFTMALVLLILGIVSWLLLLFFTSKRLRSRLIALLIMLIFLFTASSFYLFGKDFAPTAFAVTKATTIFDNLIKTKSMLDSDPTIRTELFLMTIRTFEKHPIFGAWGIDADKFSGGHSSWADTLALHGLLGIFLWFGFLLPSLRRGKFKLSVYEGNAGGTLSWMLWAFGGILNPVFFLGLGLILLWLFDLKDVERM
jgi:hypothetical protein